MNGYYIQKYNPTVKVSLESQDKIELYFMYLIELVLPKCKEVDCSYNLLTELIIPEGVEFVNCSYNHLTKLIFPKTCKWIFCHNNRLHPMIIELFQTDDPIKIQLANNLQLANINI